MVATIIEKFLSLHVGMINKRKRKCEQFESTAAVFQKTIYPLLYKDSRSKNQKLEIAYTIVARLAGS